VSQFEISALLQGPRIQTETFPLRALGKLMLACRRPAAAPRSPFTRPAQLASGPGKAETFVVDTGKFLASNYLSLICAMGYEVPPRFEIVLREASANGDYRTEGSSSLNQTLKPIV
jgi:hypothetical protein